MGQSYGIEAMHTMAADILSNESKCPSTVKPNSTVFAVSQRPELAATRNFGVVCIECYFSSVDIPLTQCLNLGSSLGSAFTIQTCLKASTPLWNGKC